MGLKFEVDTIDGLDDGIKTLYKKHEASGKYRLGFEGIDPADELKAALAKEREASKEAKRLLKEQADAKTEAERLAAEKNGEYEKLYKGAQEASAKALAELTGLRAAIADKELSSEATKLASSLTRDTARANLLAKEARAFLKHADDGVKIIGSDGSPWDTDELTAHLKTNYPFLVDGSQATGGGAAGGANGGAGKVVTRSAFEGMSPAARVAHAKSGGTITD